MSPDRRQHRGAHPSDRELFDEKRLSAIRQSVAELSWLLGRGYAMKSALKLVGDRHSLTERQRVALSRAACSDEQREKREASCLNFADIRDEEVAIDGFNLIITLEAALSGGAIISCRDGCLRDLSGIHGSYRAVSETAGAILMTGEAMEMWQPRRVTWYLDRPISNSGRLAKKITEMAEETGWNWSVEVLFDPDRAIINSRKVAVTSDSVILDGVTRWINLNSYLIESRIDAWIVDLRA
jgi:hypothetical protein